MDELNVPEETQDQIPNVIRCLSSLPTGKVASSSADDRTMALLVALDGENVTASELWRAARKALKKCPFYPPPSILLQFIYADRAERWSRLIAVKDPDGSERFIPIDSPEGKRAAALIRPLDAPAQKALEFHDSNGVSHEITRIEILKRLGIDPDHNKKRTEDARTPMALVDQLQEEPADVKI